MGELTKREQGTKCEACRRPVEIGQVVLVYDDAGEIHVDCMDPYSLTPKRDEGEPEPVVLLGRPMRYFRLADLPGINP